MNTLRDSYDTVFDFGCSITMYRWITWSDLIAQATRAKKFYKTSMPGAGLRFIYLQLNHVYTNYELTDSDLILINLPTMDRKDVCNTNDYNIDYTMASWSGKGSIFLTHVDPPPATSMSDGHTGEPRINIADMFMENLCYLKLILELYDKLPCDKIIVHTDPWDYDPVKYMSDNKSYTDHVKKYDSEATEQLMTICQRISDQYRDTLEQISDIINYEEFIIRSHAKRSLPSYDEQKFIQMDPHPAPDQAYEFVKKHFLNHSHCEIIDTDMDEIMLNFESTKALTLKQSNYRDAHLATCDPWYDREDNFYYNESWLFATPEQRHNRIPADRVKQFNWPNLTMKDMINV